MGTQRRRGDAAEQRGSFPQPQLFHPKKKGGRFQPQDGGGAVSAADLPAGGLELFSDIPAPRRPGVAVNFSICRQPFNIIICNINWLKKWHKD
jgi:hypothetical protein